MRGYIERKSGEAKKDMEDKDSMCYNENVNKKRGFTLVETLIATLIMVIVLGALGYSLTMFLNLSDMARNQDIALNAAQGEIERVANTNFIA
ncbi:MAG: type II secretion system protein, partial [Candidatus Omnitrophota bacterium]